MREDSEIQRAIDAELRARQGDETSNVSATLHCGVVRLSGFTSSYCEKYAVEGVIRAIPGVADVLNEIETHTVPSAHPSDAELRCEVLRALQTEVPSIFDRLTINVRDGAVTLEGSVGCCFLRERAESAVRRLGSLVTVHNAITLEPAALMGEVQRRVDALCHVLPGSSNARNTEVRASATDAEITLTGSVECTEARVLAEQAAWSVPGVLKVRNQITLQTP